jgi:GntR family transcriptional regulator/MocR family aminotransferase
LLTYAHHGGYLPLKKLLAEHLRLVRSVRCEPDQIILTTGIHQAVDLTTRLLADPGDKAWMEDPGYWGTRSLLASAGVEPIPVPVDDEGIAPSPATLQNPPRFIFVTPSHQYPLGMMMSLSRRRMLLEYARQRGAWIIEDDYDSEFRFEGRPVASLQGLDDNDRVIYMGTFSKTLFPGIRMGFMVLPKPLAPTSPLGFPSSIAKASSCSRRCWRTSSRKATTPRISAGCASGTRSARRCYAKPSPTASAPTGPHPRMRPACTW